MMFQCFVCEKSFNRAQHRSSHIRLKQDDAHRQYLLTQQQNLMHQFSTTMQSVTAAAAHVSPMGSPAVLVQENDIDQDDLPSSFNMVIDSLCDTDSEQSIISGPEVSVEEYEEHDKTMDEALDYLDCLPDLNELPESFHFLPDPDLDIVGGGPIPGSPTVAHTRRTLMDIEAEDPTYKWHQTAGQVYAQEPMIHARWQALFNAGPKTQAYKPFNSRLDWEIAQWAIKEKIPQKSFNRLLSIPQVLGLCFC